jgi:hypothetical protein
MMVIFLSCHELRTDDAKGLKVPVTFKSHM